MEETKKTQQMTLKNLFAKEDVRSRFTEMLGKKAQSFITSVLQIANSNDLLAKADPMSVYNAAATAATLDLPLNNNLGFAYIVPYNQKQADGSYKTVAQFQLGYKGFKQLALRTGQFVTLHSTDVREGELKVNNRLTGEMVFEWIQDEKERATKKIVGYVSYFELLNGFKQTFYMTTEELTGHGIKYSQTFRKGYGLWKDDYNGMCLKTVTKLNLSKNAPLSTEMQRAVISDQSIINNVEDTNITYVDNEAVVIDKEHERVMLLIEDAKTIEELDLLFPNVQDAQMDAFLLKKESLTKTLKAKK